jgi:CHAT domain-containing protein/tetratricopeptide (TPR) repeat protein
VPEALLSDSIRLAPDARARRAVLRTARAGEEQVGGLLEAAWALRRKNCEEASRLARAALALARRAGRADLEGRASRTLGQMLLLLGRPRAALRRLFAAASLLPPAERVLLAPAIASTLSCLGRDEEGRAEIAKARAALPPRGGARPRAVLDVAESHLLQRLDRSEEALPLLDRARETFSRAGAAPAVASVDLNRANVLSNLQRYDHAERLYRRVTTFQRAGGQESAALQSEYNHAYLLFLRGRFHEALGRFRDVRARFAALGDERHVALCDLDGAEVHLRLNLPEQAAAWAERAAVVFDRLGIVQDAARARFFAAAASRGLGAREGATADLERALADFKRLGCEAWEAVCLHRLAELDRETGDLDRALARADEAARRLTALGLVERAGRAECVAVSVLLDRGEVDPALSRLLALLARVRGIHAPWLLCEVHHKAACALEAKGRLRGALRHALRAIRTLERWRVAAPPDEYMAAFLKDKASVHEQAVRILLKLGGPRSEARAFEIAESAKGRALLDLLKGRAPASTDASAKALCREADELLREIEGLAGRLPPSDGNTRGLESMRFEEAARVRELRLTACLDRLAVRDAGAALARSAPPVRLADVTAALPADTTLVEYFQAEKELVVFVLTKTGLHVVRRAVERVQVRALLARMRFQLDRPETVTAASAPRVLEAQRRSAAAVLSDLYDLLVEPVRDLLTTTRLVLVPHGEIHGVPFQALGRDGTALLDRHEVVLAPSTAVYLHCARRSREAADGCLVLGVPDAAAPLIADEVRRVEEIHAGARAYLGADAKRSVLARDGRRARLIHVASHAAFRDDDPMLSGLHLGDGWLTTHEVYGMRLVCDVVVLSGCATGRVQVSAGDDLFGLVRGFLHAGAANLVTSLWEVADGSTLRFMDRFHVALSEGLSPAAALRAAAISIRREFPHPHHWAPFVLTGTGASTVRSPR